MIETSQVADFMQVVRGLGTGTNVFLTRNGSSLVQAVSKRLVCAQYVAKSVSPKKHTKSPFALRG